MRLFKAMVMAQQVCCHPGCPYDIQNCPRFWHKVFLLHFGEEPVGIEHPKGDDDPRWDRLFKRGYRRLGVLLKYSAIVQKAAE